MGLKLHNTFTRKLAEFKPLQEGKVGMYVCGPTVYDRAHIGNARPYVIFDVLYRLLSRHYQVTYVRNITDIDDKIITASQSSGKPIEEITERTTLAFQQDMAALGILPPTIEPRATGHVSEMIAMIEDLIAKGHAYEAEDHVLFDVASQKDYGCLSRCRRDDMIAGARVEVAPYKRDPADFVLWKPSTPDLPGWESPWGRGRPGWHIECSAMSLKHLGITFDIHGGGQDLIFPHHENEIAQSTAANGPGTFARFWLHNGVLTVNGEKMSKSLGNFITVSDLLGKVRGETIRFALLSTHYRQPLDWTEDTHLQAKSALNRLYTALEGIPSEDQGEPDPAFIEALEDDLNTPKAISCLHELAHKINTAKTSDEKLKYQQILRASAKVAGILQQSPEDWFKGESDQGPTPEEIEALIEMRNQTRKSRDFAQSDQIRDQLLAQGITLLDSPSGTTWRRV